MLSFGRFSCSWQFFEKANLFVWWESVFFFSSLLCDDRWPWKARDDDAGGHQGAAALFPGTVLMFSDILPRRCWRLQWASYGYGMERTRRWLNGVMQGFIKDLGMQCIVILCIFAHTHWIICCPSLSPLLRQVLTLTNMTCDLCHSPWIRRKKSGSLGAPLLPGCAPTLWASRGTSISGLGEEVCSGRSCLRSCSHPDVLRHPPSGLLVITASVQWLWHGANPPLAQCRHARIYEGSGYAVYCPQRHYTASPVERRRSFKCRREHLLRLNIHYALADDL